MHIAQFIPHGAISSALIFAFVFNYSSCLILDEAFAPAPVSGLLAPVSRPVRQIDADILMLPSLDSNNDKHYCSGDETDPQDQRKWN